MLHAIKLTTAALDLVKHFANDLFNRRFELCHASGRECRHDEAPQSAVRLAVHLRNTLRAHEFVELFVPAATRYVRGKTRRVGIDLVNVRVATDDDLKGAVIEGVKGRPPGPFGEILAGIRFKLGSAEININRVAAIQFIEG